MIIFISLFILLSAIITIVTAYVLDENMDFLKYIQSILFGWLFVILVILFTFLTVCKYVVERLINLFRD